MDNRREQRWTVYAYSVLGFSLVSFLAVYFLQRLQGSLPFNPSDVSGVVPHLSFNTAVSFMTNTNWQSYGGESTMSHLTQMTGLAVQNFVSAAAGMAVMAALIRGIARRRAKTLGNFWVDLTRSIVRILLPLSLVVAVLLVSQGVIQNFHGHTDVTTLEGTTQVIAGGTAASRVRDQTARHQRRWVLQRQLGSPVRELDTVQQLHRDVQHRHHPLRPGIHVRAHGEDRRQGHAVFAVMVAIWGLMSIGAMALEGDGNPNLDALGADQSVSAELAGGGNLEGKEVRFGTGASGLWAATTTGTSNGSVNAMHDSMTPLGGGIAMTHMMLGEVSPGGVGVGLNGLLIMAILAVFLAGLMVGRTPEYLGKKIQAVEMEVVVLYLLAMPVALLGFAAASVVLDSAQTANNPGPHGLTEILYAFTSAANNNGSAFAGLTTATQWYDTTLGIAMLVGRFFLIIPVLGIAGSLARKQTVPASAGTFPTHTPLFAGLVVSVVVIVAGLTSFPPWRSGQSSSSCRCRSSR